MPTHQLPKPRRQPTSRKSASYFSNFWIQTEHEIRTKFILNEISTYLYWLVHSDEFSDEAGVSHFSYWNRFFGGVANQKK
jgi:hypothetical protein